ncbi:MAG: hypothetical protein OHK93_004768 [Ramalina farinacea]|uniref:D-mandelate dehydrogenase n=1 Tax=Ramalina farinacea TaxID=258253 RepID=A0AA43QWH7_9LECA|nr:hypothetical protein [Ramalina farinacea]
MRASDPDILGCTDFAGMGSMGSAAAMSAESPAAVNGTTAVNGTSSPTHQNPTASTAHHDASLTNGDHAFSSSPKPIILHLGAPIQHHPDIYADLHDQFHLIRPDPADLERHTFIKHLKDGTWGNFSAIMKPRWSTGGEMHPWDKPLIDLLPSNMKVMAAAGAGFDWVDTKALAERGILYCNGLGASTESVANTALYHLISVFTHATASSLAARSPSPSAFQKAHITIPLISHNPSNHTLAIVGLGNIGHLIAQRARALGMTILYHDIARKPLSLEREVSATYYPTLTSMLPHADCLILATPAGDPIVTAHTIALLPRGARIINIARGNLVDEAALADALDSGHISAAGLDVHAREPVVYERFQRMRQVQLTCHTGGASVETNAGFEALAMGNVRRVLEGGQALTAVNKGEVEEWRERGGFAQGGGGGDGEGG